MKKKLGMMFVCGLLVLTSSWCFADTVLFTDLTGAPASPAYIINPTDTVGFEFASSATATLDSIEIALSEFASDPATVTLYQDSSGSLGTKLESWTVANLPTFFGGTDIAPVTLSSNGSVQLTQGDSYWLVVSNPDNPVNWDYGSASGIEDNNGTVSATTHNMGAFEVTGSGPASVPEPMAALFLGPTLFGLVAVGRRFKK